MDWEDAEDTNTYAVVRNDEEQYSIWPIDRPLPLGWQRVGRTGRKDECLEYINEVWVDMRPRSLRLAMAEAAGRVDMDVEAHTTSSSQASSEPSDTGDDHRSLVEHLAVGDHPVRVRIRPEPTPRRLKECIDRGFVHIEFVETRGGTEIRVRLDGDATRVDDQDLDRGSGHAHLVGTLTLDYVPVRCVADIDIGTMAGKGHLEPEAASKSD